MRQKEGGTKRLEPPVTLHWNDHEGTRAEVLSPSKPFVVPHQADFSSAEAHAAAAGPLRWNRQQGFYVYRADRMIQSGGWSNLRTLDEHSKLARVALSFDPRLDDAFRINVAKMRVQLPTAASRADRAGHRPGDQGCAEGCLSSRWPGRSKSRTDPAWQQSFKGGDSDADRKWH